jgi:hypothetical protein
VVGDFGPNVGAISITLDDEITPKLRQTMKEFPKIASRALRHTGWFVQGDMKNAMTSGRGTQRQGVLKPSVESNFRKQQWENPVTKKIEKRPHLPHRLKVPTSHTQMLKKHIRHPFRWMGSRLSKHRRLARAIGYEMRADKTLLRVGWLSKSSVKWAREYQDGKTQPVTKAMRGYFFAIGLPIGKRTIRTKADPFIPNWFRANKAKMVKVFSDRFILKYNEWFRKKTA